VFVNVHFKVSNTLVNKFGCVVMGGGLGATSLYAFKKLFNKNILIYLF